MNGTVRVVCYECGEEEEIPLSRYNPSDQGYICEECQ